MAKAPSTQDVAVLAGLRRAMAALPGTLLLTGTGGIFPNSAAGRNLKDAAIADGSLIEKQVPSGTARRPTTAILGVLTEKGKQRILDADSPKAVLETLLPAIQKLAAKSTSGGNDEVLKAELTKATEVCNRTIESAFAKLQESVEKAFGKLTETVVKAASASQPQASVDLSSLADTLQKALAKVAGTVTVSSPQSEAETKQVAPPTQAITQPVKVDVPPTPPDQTRSQEQMRKAIKEAYEHLCLFIEFRDRLVEIPRLYHEAVKRLPGMKLGEFHAELERMKQERVVELHVLNEVREAQDPELAIFKND